jgi:hypothetical protein
MVLATYGVRFHTNADQVIGAEQIESLLFGEGHGRPYFIAIQSSLRQPRRPVAEVACFRSLRLFT